MRTPARFPGVPPAAGHYESFYAKACHPDGGLAVWIRYTVHKPPGEPPLGAVWFTLFDAAAGVIASKARYERPAAGEDHYIDMDGCHLAPGHVVGRAPSALLEPAWELRFSGEERPLSHLPHRWMYGAPLPRTKLVSPHPHVTFAGWVDIGSRRIELSGWPGMVGHNWGSEHARRTIWIHGAGFAGRPDDWLDLAIARVGLGPLTTPWIANGALCLDGRRHRLGGLGRIASTRIEENVESCRFRLKGEAIELDGTVGAPGRSFVGWEYAQPAGAKRQTINCSIADLHLEVARPGAAPVTLELAAAAAYELQMEERYAAIPTQPFPDG